MGRLASVKGRKYQIQDIWHTHHEIMRLLLMGWKEVDIAHYLNVTPVMVSYTKNSEIVKRQMAILQDARDLDAIDVADEIRKLAPVCLDKLRTIMEDENAQKRLQADIARDLLDRAGFSPVRKLAVAETRHLSSDEIEEIKRIARENNAVISDREAIDAEFTSVQGG